MRRVLVIGAEFACPPDPAYDYKVREVHVVSPQGEFSPICIWRGGYRLHSRESA